jgi:hypothetical protein
MTLSLLVKQETPTRNLTGLVRQIQTSGPRSLGFDWPSWLEGAMNQLETDDSIDVQLTDQLAEILSDLEDAFSTGADPSDTANRLLMVFKEPSIEDLWRARAGSLGYSELNTTLWNDLHRALDAAEKGKSQVVSRWLELVEQKMIAKWESYEHSEILDEEITSESVAGHRLLCDGVENWLCALSELRYGLAVGNVNRTSVLQNAECGQRLLVALEVIQKEMVNPLQWLVEAWRN